MSFETDKLGIFPRQFDIYKYLLCIAQRRNSSNYEGKYLVICPCKFAFERFSFTYFDLSSDIIISL